MFVVMNDKSDMLLTKTILRIMFIKPYDIRL